MAAQTGFLSRVWAATKTALLGVPGDVGGDVLTRREFDDRRGRMRGAYDFGDPFSGSGRFNTSGSGTTLLAPSHQRLVAACRDLVRNNPYARSAVRVLSAASVRYGITPKFPSGNKRAQAAMEKAWAKWVRLADATGQHDFYGLMHRVDWQFWEVGECFVRLHVLHDAEAIALGIEIPFQLELIESEQVATETFTAPNGNRVIAGIEVNKRGRKIAVWAYASNAEDPVTMGVREKVRLPLFDGFSGEILHIANPMRGNLRGEPGLAVVGTRLEALDVYQRALLTRAQVEACFSGFITTAANSTAANGGMPVDPALAGLGPVSKSATPGAPPILHMKPGTVQELPEGKDIKFASPQSSGGLEVFARETLRAIATGVGVPYELMTGDLSDVSYTSFRAGTLQFKDQIEMHQWLVLIPQFCLPVIMLWSFLGYLKGKWDVMVPEGMDWGLPKPNSVDPVKDAMALLIELKAGITDLGQVKADRGEDWRKTIDTVAEIRDYAKALGLEGFIPEGFAGQLTAAAAAADAAAAREDSAALNSDSSSGTGYEQTPRQSRQAKKRQAK